MNILTDAFFWITTGLLVPVMILLLLGFIYALCMVGSFYSVYRSRQKYRLSIDSLIEDAAGKLFGQIDYANKVFGNQPVLDALVYAQLKQWAPIHTSKALADFEAIGEAKLQKSKALMRLGPMLGLMGTLIPMGPALVGLATGDIAMMALNMQVAFSTTVIGVFVGGIGFILYTICMRWFSEDYHKIQHIIDLAQDEQS